MAKEYHKNPRLITPAELEQIKENLEELGDISGIVHNIPTDEIVGGNQRSKIIDFDKCEKHIIENLKKPDKWGTVAYGYVIWNGIKLNYRQVKWTPEQCDRANITANSLSGKWDEALLKSDIWKDVPGLDKWNLPFLLEAPPILNTKIDKVMHTSNKYHDSKPLIFISLNLVQRQVIVPEKEAQQFLNGIIELVKREKVQILFDDVYKLAFDRLQQILIETENAKQNKKG